MATGGAAAVPDGDRGAAAALDGDSRARGQLSEGMVLEG